MLKSYLQNDEGATAFVFALTIPLLIGGIALAVELGHWNQKKSKLQDLADVSAKAAAYEIMVLDDKADFELAGRGHAFENGFNYSIGNVIVLSPPVTGKYAGKKGVEVIIQQDQPLYFTKFFGQQSFTQETRATALMLSGIPACILALSETASPAFEVTGSAIIDVNGCRVHTNSSDPQSVQVGSKDNFKADCLTSVGGIVAGSGTNLTECADPEPYSLNVADPYADVVIAENVPAMPCQNLKSMKSKWDYYLEPGRYCSRVRASGAVYLTEPGVYIFDGVDLEISSQYAYLGGRETTLIFTNGGLFKSGNGGEIDVTAPKSGPYTGIAFYYDPLTTPMHTDVKINGNNYSSIEGVFYAPTVDLVYNGGSDGNSKCTSVIANTMILTGNASFTNTGCDPDGIREIGGGSGVALVE